MTGSPAGFPAIWLRHNCPCPECRDPVTGQRLLEIISIPNGCWVPGPAWIPGSGGPDVEWQELGIPVYLPSRAMCTDNASMIAAAAWWQLEHLGPSPLATAADPNLRLRLLD